MHWAPHGHTAAEIIHDRADAARLNMGMTSWQWTRPTREEAVIAKNYLTVEELEALNRIVNAYLEFAELQALSRKPMYMRDWISKLDDFLRMGEREILTHAGTISHEQALRKADLEFDEYRVRQLAQTSQVEKDFDEAVKALPRPRRRRKADGHSRGRDK
jgi:hypothetical protein